MTRRLLLAGVGAACVFADAPVQAQHFKMLAGWSESNVMAYMPGKVFKENAEKAS